MGFEEYTWQKYYEDLYHRQKKVNNALAVELGETETKISELNIALNRVIGSPFWRVLAPVRKIASVVRKDGSNAAVMPVSDSDYAIDESYKERLALYEDFYGQWIRTDETEVKYASYDFDNDLGNEFGIIRFSECLDSLNPVDKLGSAKWLVFMQDDAILAKGASERLKHALAEKTEVKFLYCDEDYIFFDDSKKTYRLNPFFKPDWSPDTLDSFFYVGSFFAIREDIVKSVKWPSNSDILKNVYEYVLRISTLVGKHYDTPEVCHVSEVLVHNKISENYYSAAKEIAADNAHDFRWSDVTSAVTKYDLNEDKLLQILGINPVGCTAEFDDIKINCIKGRFNGDKECGSTDLELISGQDPAQKHLLYKYDAEEMVSVLILTKDHPETLDKCISSFVQGTDYNKLEFIIYDNGSSEQNKKLYEDCINDILAGFSYKYIHNPMEFNFSKLCNLAAKEASGNLLLFMNDDIEIVQKDWLKLMAGYARLPYAGAVGAKLLYANTDKIQHIGITNLEIGPSHKLVIYPDNRSYYYGRNMLTYDMLGVTAACMLISKDKFIQVGGFNEKFAVAYNDVDFSMKVCEAGYNNIQCNGALLYHYESLTRGQDAGDDDKWNRLLHEKEKLYLIHPKFFKADPYYNVNMIGNHSNYLSNFDYGYNNHLKVENVRQFNARQLAKMNDNSLKISLEFAGIQAMHNLGEPEIIEFRGWSFREGCDNKDHISKIILVSKADEDKKEGGQVAFEVKTNPSPRDDLKKVFPNECNIKLCGFVGKVLKEDLPEGTYEIGIEADTLNHDLVDVKELHNVFFTDIEITV